MTVEANPPEAKGRKPLLAVPRGESAEKVERRPDERVMAFPYLILPGFVVLVGLLVFMTLCAWLVNAPLQELANPDVTPNPSKAPWYFMNLQELLLHMNPSLAGVIIPTALFMLLCAIPYIDRKLDNVGHWFYSRRGAQITAFSAIYTVLVVVGLIVWDSYFSLDPLKMPVPRSGGAVKAALIYLVQTQGLPALLADDIVTGWLVPLAVMGLFTGLLVLIVRLVWKGEVEEIMLALFTGFVFTWLTLTIIGFLFRGPDQLLGWPWSHPGGYNPLREL